MLWYSLAVPAKTPDTRNAPLRGAAFGALKGPVSLRSTRSVISSPESRLLIQTWVSPRTLRIALSASRKSVPDPAPRIVKALERGVHECDEPLTDHQGHGSARQRPPSS